MPIYVHGSGNSLDGHGSNDSGTDKPLACYYCKKLGHFHAQCPKLNVKSVANSVVPAYDISEVSDQGCLNRQDLFLPYRFSGTVSVSEDSTSNEVSILRNIAASFSAFSE